MNTRVTGSVGLAALAAVVVSACGGGSAGSTGTGTSAARTTSASAATASTTPAAHGAEPVSAVHGGFQTAIPSGYSNNLAVAAAASRGVEYAAVGSRIDGFATNLVVYRGQASRDLDAVAKLALRRLSQRPSFLPKVHGISSLHALSVDGEPALAFDYQIAAHTPTRHHLVFVIHGQWAYQISDTTVSAQYAASLRALGEVIRGWRWQ